MNTTDLMHGRDYNGENIAGWWIGQKMDGWRMVWTGSELITRQGQRYDAPAWFTAGLPSTPLDGELTTTGQSTCHGVTSAVQSGDWRRLRFCPFDIPSAGTPFETAQATIAAMALPRHCRPVA